jgi:hypothetical protein
MTTLRTRMMEDMQVRNLSTDRYQQGLRSDQPA